MTRIHVRRGIVLGAVSAAAVALGACGGGSRLSVAPPTTAATTSAPPTTAAPAATTSAPNTTAAPAATTIPTQRPTTVPSATTSTPPTTPATTATTAPATTAPPIAVAAQPCKTAQLTAALKNGSAAAGTFYYDLTFLNEGTAPCTLFGYSGVSYVRGDSGIQTGDAADRNFSIAGQSKETVVTLAAGGTAHAVLAAVDIGNYPPSDCLPTAVRGLRVYPPNQTTALFVPWATTGCQATGVHQLGIGFVVPAIAGF